MTVYQWQCVLGIPSIVLAQLGYLARCVLKTAKETKAIALGVQALLRMQLRRDYERCNTQGYATIKDRDDFENCWVQYHELGANGVMDDVHKKFLALPTGGEDV